MGIFYLPTEGMKTFSHAQLSMICLVANSIFNTVFLKPHPSLYLLNRRRFATMGFSETIRPVILLDTPS
ncbi:MAG TPA: hypothetical protein DD706_15675 [Nitrospiraceae bacterium]|nr:hypothetical protein [Nitrospiraceae bacterium]